MRFSCNTMQLVFFFFLCCTDSEPNVSAVPGECADQVTARSSGPSHGAPTTISTHGGSTTALTLYQGSQNVLRRVKINSTDNPKVSHVRSEAAAVQLCCCRRWQGGGRLRLRGPTWQPASSWTGFPAGKKTFFSPESVIHLILLNLVGSSPMKRLCVDQTSTFVTRLHLRSKCTWRIFFTLTTVDIKNNRKGCELVAHAAAAAADSLKMNDEDEDDDEWIERNLYRAAVSSVSYKWSAGR